MITGLRCLETLLQKDYLSWFFVKMKKYRVIDLQGVGFMGDTHEEPQTLEELRERFWGLYQNEELGEEMEFENFTKEYIEDLWEVRIEEV